ncbi:unnamed protein product [Ilex paraguariensis]|uniref:Secreted protein n=1 Tax=Ilex paraguariensis TaxID=185542 RepID=A0ABC8URF5_9AQUA
MPGRYHYLFLFCFCLGSRTNISLEQSKCNSNEPHNEYDKELFEACMRRFLYTRCHDSFEFLATLKCESVLEMKLRVIF